MDNYNMVKARVKDIRINRPHKIVEAIVEIKYRKETWEKTFRLSADKKITFAQFKEKVEEEVIKDLKIDEAIKDIKGRSTFFNLDVL